MLSLGKLAPGQQQYYLDSVARGMEEYYTGAREAPGLWIGTASAHLRLAGEVDAGTLGRILEHVDPTGVCRLTSSHSVPVVAGFDATFCAPKSVSLLFALGEREVSNEVRNAADAAVSAALEVLERAACRVRRGKGGQTVLDADGFVAAAFRHRTSRAGDPHLHTHVVIANLAHSPSDDRWTALDGRPLYSWSSAAGHLYEAHLRWELTRRLGVEWGPVRNGIADIAGFSKPVLREFSTRRREIEAHLDERGQHGARAAQVATYATRQAKDPNLDAEGLLPGWRRRAAALGFDDAAIAGLLDRARVVEPPTLGSSDADRLYRWLASPEGLTAKASTFGERDVIKAICNALPAGAPVDRILGLADGFLRSEHVLAVRDDRTEATIRRADGTVITSRTDETRWTTPEMLEVESRLVESAIRRRGTGVAITVPQAVDAAVAARALLSGEQERMVRTVCSSGDGVDIVEGVAGAGKTFALAAARDAWHASGHRVIGCSLAARAAKHLEDDAGIPSSTIDRLLASIERHQTALDDTTVLVIDEAAMVGTRKLARLLAHAEATGAKVVLVGDPCQLPEIDAGGSFRGLRSRLGASDLTENRRQTEAWERETLAELRAGDPTAAFDTYVEWGRVRTAATDDEVRELLVDEWMNTRTDGEDVLMVAARLADVDDLNRRARAILNVEGYLDADQIVIDGRGFVEGDEILALRNDYRLGLLNGTRAVIEQIDTSRHQMILLTGNGERRIVPFAYAEAGHLAHGYATTIHKAQGTTVDHCLILVDETASREHAYTALSRGRHRNDLFAVARETREEQHIPEVMADVFDELRTAVRRSVNKRLALDEIDVPPAARLDELRRQRDELNARLGAGPLLPPKYRQLSDAHRNEQHLRQGAQWRLDATRRELDNLGPIGRRTHLIRRRQVESRIAGFEADVCRHDHKLGKLQQELDTLAPLAGNRNMWEQRHQALLDRIDRLDMQIQLAERLDRVATLGRDRGFEAGLSIEP